MAAPLAKLCYPLAGGLAAPARGEGTVRGGFASVVGLARNLIRAGLSALIVGGLVYRYLASHTTRVRADGHRRRATIVLAGLGAIRAIAPVKGNYPSSGLRTLCCDR